jgi:peptide subunit release factor 1 (eRF1)
VLVLKMGEIKELADLAPEKATLSLYLNTDRAADPNREYKQFLHGLLRNAEERGADPRDIERVSRYFDREFTGQARTVAVFAHDGNDLWRVYELQLPLPDLVVVNDLPFVAPLLYLMEDNEQQCVVLLDKEKARIFGFYMGEFEDLGELINENLHGKQKQGGWAQARMARHHLWGVKEHLKKVAEVLLALFLQRDFDRLLIGIPTPELEPLFEKALHPWLQERIGAWFDLRMYADTGEIKKEILEIQDHLEEEEEAEALRRLRESLGPGKMGVAGVSETLFEMQRGSLETLILKKGLQLPGRECIACHYLDANPEAGEECPICEGKVRMLPDITGEIVKMALGHGVKLRFVVGDDDFEAMGNIGGILRFRQ